MFDPQGQTQKAQTRTKQPYKQPTAWHAAYRFMLRRAVPTTTGLCTTTCPASMALRICLAVHGHWHTGHVLSQNEVSPMALRHPQPRRLATTDRPRPPATPPVLLVRMPATPCLPASTCHLKRATTHNTVYVRYGHLCQKNQWPCPPRLLSPQSAA